MSCNRPAWHLARVWWWRGRIPGSVRLKRCSGAESGSAGSALFPGYTRLPQLCPEGAWFDVLT